MKETSARSTKLLFKEPFERLLERPMAKPNNLALAHLALDRCKLNIIYCDLSSRGTT